MIDNHLANLRAEMKKRGITVYIVPTADFHESEYVGEHFKERAFLTGFTGSAGTAVITMREANLFTDGRYFLQAEEQLKGSSVLLRKIGEEGVPNINDYIEDVLPEGGRIGFDGRTVNAAWGRRLASIASKKNGSLSVEEDLVDLIWQNRPPLPASPIMIFDEKYTGESVRFKLSAVRKAMEQKHADIHLLSSLYDIAYLLNIRGNDIEYVPVALSYLALSAERCLWFVQEQVLSDELRAFLNANGIETRPYDSFYEYIRKIPAGRTVTTDFSVANYRILRSIPEGVTVLDEPNPSVSMRAVKNKTQLDNLRNAHRKDAVAMTRFMYWLKTNVGKIPMTEISVSEHLAALRSQQEGFLSLSFETICAYAQHGAIVHYSATSESDVSIKPEGFLLVDSGGHYLEGTTDITRTFAMGPLTQEMKTDFTRVCCANINLASARFLYGCSGLNLDILAREPLWEADLDYKHGTGHGVGYVLNVHEGPNAFRWRSVSERVREAVLEEGMVTTDEPGLYIPGKYGIRTENELICCKGTKNEYGQFMYFENLTYVPIDLDALVPEQMTAAQRRYLNEYHKTVYEKIAPFLNEKEAAWLKKYTKAI